jgi:calpain-15
VEVVLDEMIPTIEDELCFSCANGPELWVVLVEKAFAKLNGTYARLDAG